MGRRRDDWRQMFSALGESLIGVLRAELEVIAEAWKRSLRETAVFLGLVTVAGYVALVCLPTLLIIALVAALDALGLPLWGAALVVAAVVALSAYLVGRLALKRLRQRFDSPVAAVRDRFTDHVAWWHENVSHDHRALGGHDGNDVASKEEPGTDAGDRTAGEPPARV